MNKIFIFCLFFVANFLFSASFVWTGDVSSDWSNAGNWTKDGNAATAPPGAGASVQIPVVGGGSVFPIIDNSSALCRNLVIDSGATLNGGSSGAVLTIVGAVSTRSILNDGTFSCGNGKVVLATGAGTRVIRNQSSSAIAFYDLEVDLTDPTGIIKLEDPSSLFVVSNELTVKNGTLSLNQKLTNCNGDVSIDAGGVLNASYKDFIVGGDLVVNGTFTVNSGYAKSVTLTSGSLNGTGVFNAESMTLNIGGGMGFSGSFSAGTSNVVFDGTLDGILASNSFYNLKINKNAANTLNMTGDVIVSNYFQLQQGGVDCGTENFTILSGVANINGGNLTFASSSAGIFDIQNGGLVGSGGVINAGSATFRISKNMNYFGTFNRGTSTVVLNSSNNCILNAHTFYNLTFDKGASNIVAVGGDITVENEILLSKGIVNFTSYNMTVTNGDVNLNGGELNFGSNNFLISTGDLNINGGLLSFSVSNPSTFSLNNGSITGSFGNFNAGKSVIKVAKNWYYQGLFDSYRSAVKFNSTNESEIISGTSFYDLAFIKDAKLKQISSTTTTTPGEQGQGVVTFTGDLTYDNGYFLGGLRTITSSSEVFEKGYVNIKRAGTSSITITKYTGTKAPGGTALALKNYVVVESGVNDFSQILSFYVSSELDGNTAGNMATWRSDDGGGTWNSITGSGTDANSRYGTFSPVVNTGSPTYFTATDESNTSLPVEFAEELFTGEYKNGAVGLSWLTHSETGLRGFIVYRSENLNSNFEQIDSWEDNLTLVSEHDENGGFTTNDTKYSYSDNSVKEGKVYYYRISAYCSDTDNEYHPKTVKVETDALDSDEPEGMFLEQNYPNPFNAATNISYAVSKETMVSLVLYNSNGQIAKVLVDNMKAPGHYSVVVSNNDISTGVYYYVMKAAGYKGIKKMIVVK